MVGRLPDTEIIKREKRLSGLAKLFLKLGVIGFGGPAVHIAMMEEEVVRKRAWMSHQHFLDLVGATNLIPGPNSTEMTRHIGHERAGWNGCSRYVFYCTCRYHYCCICMGLSVVWSTTTSAAVYLWYQASHHSCYCCYNDCIRQKSIEVSSVRYYRSFISNSCIGRFQ